MTQAIGANARISYVPESTWGTTPGGPSMKLLKAATYGEGLGADIEELVSQSINSSRSIEAVRGGNISVSGSVPFELPTLGIATLLKHALGTSSTTGTGPYVHTIKRGTLPAGLTIEKGFTDIAQYFRFRGCKVQQLQLQVGTQGFATGSLDFIGKDVTAAGTSLGSPTALTHTPFVQHEAATEEGGSAAVLLNFNATITNEIDQVRAIGSRYIAAATEGKGNTTGEISLMFENLTVFNKWLNETASTLKLTFTSGAQIMEIFFPNIRYVGDAVPKISAAQGIVVPLRFRAVYDNTEATDMKITITTTEATI